MILTLLLAAALDTTGILRLSDRNGALGHGCAVSSQLAITNFHIAGGDEQRGFQWSTAEGEERGYAETVPDGQSPYADITFIRAVPHENTHAGLFPRWFEKAKHLPAVGSRVTFVGFEFSKGRKKGFIERRFETTVQFYIAGLMILADGGVPGSSGSCVLDSDGNLVAINSAFKPFGKEGEGGTLGVAIPLWSIPPAEVTSK